MAQPFIIVFTLFSIPLIYFLLCIFLKNSFPRFVSFFCTICMGVCSLLASIILSMVWSKEVFALKVPWLTFNENSKIDLLFKLDFYAGLMLFIVTFISFLVHLYSIEYKKGDKHYSRYFAYLGLFTFSMIGVVISHNLLQIFIFWELVGFCSYLLIGFWYDKQVAVQANKKAFIINRIADVGLVIAIAGCWKLFGTLDLNQIYATLPTLAVSKPALLLIGFGFFIGASGKSAQFPFQVWLPDAMEGPTPVSALIHAATMVAAGVYLIVKISGLLLPEVNDFILIIGSITALIAALSATAQTDLKKVLAYSTISQLGMMMVAVGCKQYDIAMFHLVTHAFFKACLFLSAGSIINGLHQISDFKTIYPNINKQNMQLMGGLAHKMPFTLICFIISGLSLAGLPLFSGFLSKELILSSLLNVAQADNWKLINFVAIIITSFCTTFYVVKTILWVFIGKNRLSTYYPKIESINIHESGILMIIPMLILALFSLWIPFSNNPFHINMSENWFFNQKNISSNHDFYVLIISISVIIIGSISAYYSYQKAILKTKLEKTPGLLKHHYYIDFIYKHTFVKGILYISKTKNQFDQKVLNAFIDYVAVFTVVYANIIAWKDKYIVDGMIHSVTYVLQTAGNKQNNSSQGFVQQSIIASLVIFISLMIWFLI